MLHSFFSYIWLFFLISALISGCLAFVQSLMLKQQAEKEWVFWSKKTNSTSQNKQIFCKIYQNVYSPRAQAYLSVFLLVITFLSPLCFWILKITWATFSSRYLLKQKEELFLLSNQQNWVYEGSTTSQFFIYFGLIIFWSFIASLFARHYHFKTPSSLINELKKQNFFTS